MSRLGFALIVLAFVVGTYSVTDYIVTRAIVSKNHSHVADYVAAEASLHRERHPNAEPEYMRPLHLQRLEKAIASSGGSSLWGIDLFRGLGIAIVMFAVGFLLVCTPGRDQDRGTG